MLTRRQSLLVLAARALSVAAPKYGLTSSRIANAHKEPENWLTYSGDYYGWRYSGLDQIDTNQVRRLAVKWAFQIDEPGRFETTPLVADGIMYLSAPGNEVIALDASTGRVIWRYKKNLPEPTFHCCGRINRGVAMLGDKIYLATLDAHVVALDSKSGNVVWDVAATDYRKGYAFTGAPMAIKDKIVAGPSGGEWGIQGFIDAYDAETGQREWRFHAIPQPGQFGHDTWEGDSWKTGGAPAWMSGSYDPELNLIYLGTGNPGPDLYGDDREGANLFTDCVVALDADSGERKWHFQFTPHDLHDWDANIVPILVDATYAGRQRKLLIQANRNGFFFVLDRINGEFLHARPFVKTTWAKQDRPGGMPQALASATPSPEGSYVCPGLFGGTNWMSPAYSPRTNLMYVTAREECATYFSKKQEFVEGRNYWGGHDQPEEGGWSAMRALDPTSGDLRWEYRHTTPTFAGALATAGDVVFTADMEGNFIALHARTGSHLWHFQTGGPIIASPMSYAVRGQQHVAIAANSTLLAFALPERDQ